MPWPSPNFYAFVSAGCGCNIELFIFKRIHRIGSFSISLWNYPMITSLTLSQQISLNDGLVQSGNKTILQSMLTQIYITITSVKLKWKCKNANFFLRWGAFRNMMITSLYVFVCVYIFHTKKCFILANLEDSWTLLIRGFAAELVNELLFKNSIECRFNATQYQKILHTSLQRWGQNMNQMLNLQKTHHIAP